jgi:hypothetical protein
LFDPPSIFISFFFCCLQFIDRKINFCRVHDPLKKSIMY